MSERPPRPYQFSAPASRGQCQLCNLLHGSVIHPVRETPSCILAPTIFKFSSPASLASLVVLAVKNPPANAGDIRDASSTPGSGRSLGEEHGNPLQYYCLEDPMDRGAWQAQSIGSPRADTTEVTKHAHPQHTVLCSPTLLKTELRP